MSSAAPDTGRLYFMDAARGTLMMLGIFLHTANVYGIQHWLVNDRERSALFDALVAFIHDFRMPAFFMISGYFASRSLTRYGVAKFLGIRGVRIGVPLLVTALTLNVLQLYLVSIHGGDQRSFGEYLRSGHILASFVDGRGIAHLWFLVNLLLYFLLFALAVFLLRGSAIGHKLVLGCVRITPIRHPALLLILLPLLNVAVLALLHAVPALYTTVVVPVPDLLLYAPFFCFGLMMFAVPKALLVMTEADPGVLLVTLAAAGAALEHPFGGTGLAANTIEAYFGCLLSWLGAYWTLVFFKTLCNRATPLFKVLADSSYTIYLFHELVVILFAWWLLGSDASIYAKFVVIVVATFVVTLSLDRLVIRRADVLAVLFNGKQRAA